MPLGLSATDERWFQGKYRSGATIQNIVIDTPAQITSDQNNYQLQSGATYIRLSSDANRTITGFAAPTSPYSNVIRLVNVGSFILYILHQSSLSSSANRVRNSDGGLIVLHPDSVLDISYDNVSNSWRTSFDFQVSDQIFHPFLLMGG